MMPRSTLDRVLCAALIAWFVCTLPLVRPAYPVVYDFGEFVASGAAVWDHEPPYDLAYLDAYAKREGIQFSGASGNLNPPPALFLFAPLARLGAWNGYLAMFALNVVALAAALGLSAVRHRPPAALGLLAAVHGGVAYTLAMGQLYGLGWAAVAGADALTDEPAGRTPARSAAAGALLGLLVAAKPNFALWAAVLCVGGEPVIGAAALATAALAHGMALAAFGTEAYAGWWALVVAANQPPVATNAAWPAVLGWFGLPRVAATSVTIAGAAAATGWAAWRARTATPDRAALHTVGALASILFAPLAWSAYTLVVLPFALAKTPRPAAWAALIALALPTWWLVRFDHGPMLALLPLALTVWLADTALVRTPASASASRTAGQTSTSP